MRWPVSAFSAILILAIAAVIGYYPVLNHWRPAAQRTVAPVAAPGSARIEGPYFSERDRIGDRIIAAINRSRQSIDLAIYSLTEGDIATALDAAHQRGVRIRIVADQNQAYERHSEIPFLQSHGIPVRLSGGYRGTRSIMHNKFAVFDSRLAETGSFNWTTSADDFNYENAIFIADPTVATRFEDEFETLWKRAR